MKFFRFVLMFAVAATAFSACKNDSDKLWEVKMTDSAEKAVVTDISGEFYDPSVPLEAFKQKYPWFQGTVDDETYGEQRTDTAEVKIYREAISKIDKTKLENDLTQLFAQVRHYFPEFKNPQVFLYSSVLQSVMEPVFYKPAENYLFIDVTGFMGENNPNYNGLEKYFQLTMNPKNILPKVAETLAENFVPANLEESKFLDQMVYNGKIMTLLDAFMPELPEALKIGYTQAQYDWAIANEANIWNFFVENNLVFSDDLRLGERFLRPAPFSKFYTAVDNESSPRVGIFTGWQICRAFYRKNPKTPLQQFLKLNAQQIFNESAYKPRPPDE